MATNNFNDLLLHLLKEIGIRLERLEGRTDRMIDQKANKTDIEVVVAKLDQKTDKTDIDTLVEKLDQKVDKADLDSITEKLDQKADKADLNATNARLDSIAEKLDQKADKADLNATDQKVENLTEKVDTLGTQMTDVGRRLDRIEGGIGTLKWIVGAEVAAIGVILAFIRAC